MKKYIKRVPEIHGIPVPTSLSKEFCFLYIPYPFYCISPIIKVGRKAMIEDPKKITFLLREPNYFPRRLSGEYVFERVIHEMMLWIIDNRETFGTIRRNRGSFETMGKLIYGGFKI